jgi:class 3 adenylate cyclase/CHASE2 domain-containing sensor protein
VNLDKLKSPPVLLTAAAVAIVLCLDLSKWNLLTRFEWITYDWRMRQANRFNHAAATNLGFVFINNHTIDVFSRGDLGTNLQFGLYWPRHIYGRAVHELSAQGAKIVGLDILFADRRLDHGPGSDQFLAAQLQRAGNVVLGTDREVVPDSLFRNRAAALGAISIERDVDGVLRRVQAFHDIRIWHDAINQAARLSNWDLVNAQVSSNQIIFPLPEGKTKVLPLNVDGYFDPSDLNPNLNPNLNLNLNPQGFSRLYLPYEKSRVWHLGIILAAQHLGLDLSKAEVDLQRGRITFPPNPTLNLNPNLTLPVDSHGDFLIDWTLPMNDPRLTQHAFESLIADSLLRLQGSSVPPRFKDKLVIVGSTALGNELRDRGATPLQKDTFLTSSHWNVANSLITGRFIHVAPRWLDLLLICLLGVGGSVFACKLSTARASTMAALLGAIYVVAAAAAQIFARYSMPLVTPLLSLSAGYVALVTYQAFFEQSEKRRVKDIFSKLVSPSVVQELLSAKTLSLVGKRRRVTVLFSDLRGFTEMTDKSHARAEQIVRQLHDHDLDPDLALKSPTADAEKIFDEESQEVVKTVNLYLGAIADTIKKHGGTLDKYIGDCVMAFWGAPTDHERHAACCVQAAIEAQRAIHRLNEERRQENARRERANFEQMALGQTSRLRLLDVLSVGTGINTGTVDAGLMGSQDAQNYTVFGRDVNVASRLEKLAGGGRILIGQATYLDLKKQDPTLASTCIELPPAEVRGIREAIKIYEVPWK